MEQRTPEWFAARKGRVTGSSVGSILNINPYSNSSDVLRRMVREYHGQESEFKGNVATDYGTLNEPNALTDYMMEHDRGVIECGFYTYQDWLGASPDGLIDNDGLIEIKCPYGLRHGGEFKPLSEQPHYHAQIQIQLFVTGRQWCDFYQWSPYDSKLERVNIDHVWLEESLEELYTFYNVYLVAREDENAWRYIDGGELANAYNTAKAALEVAKSELDDAKMALIEATNCEGGKIGNINITRVNKKGSIGYAKALKDIAPGADLELYRGKDSSYWLVK